MVRVDPSVVGGELHHDVHVVVAVGGQSVTDREPCDALIVVAVDDVHARQIIADDGLPFLIGQYALAGLDGERAVPHALPAMLSFGIVLASHVGRERIVLAFPDAVASVEPAAYLRIRRRRLAIHVKRGKHVAARAHEMLVGVFIAPSLAEQVAHQAGRVRTPDDIRYHTMILRPRARHGGAWRL